MASVDAPLGLEAENHLLGIDFFDRWQKRGRRFERRRGRGRELRRRRRRGREHRRGRRRRRRHGLGREGDGDAGKVGCDASERGIDVACNDLGCGCNLASPFGENEW